MFHGGVGWWWSEADEDAGAGPEVGTIAGGEREVLGEEVAEVRRGGRVGAPAVAVGEVEREPVGQLQALGQGRPGFPSGLLGQA